MRPDGTGGGQHHQASAVLSREAFLADLLDEGERDIRRALERGAHAVQIDFTEGRLAVKLDPTRGLLADFIALNFALLSAISTIGSEPATIPQPANIRI